MMDHAGHHQCRVGVQGVWYLIAMHPTDHSDGGHTCLSLSLSLVRVLIVVIDTLCTGYTSDRHC